MTHTDLAVEHGRIERHGNDGVIRFERRLAHPIERVWDAITTPALLAEWWLPFPAAISIDLRVGGTMTFAPLDGTMPPMTCTVLEVEAPRHLVHTHLDGASIVTWSLSVDGDGCVLSLVQTTTDIDAVLAQGHPAGLHCSLDRLDPALRGAPVPWDWDHLSSLQREYERHVPINTSPRAAVVTEYMRAFAAGDHRAVLACLTDDIVWDIVGHALLTGKDQFDANIGGEEFTSLATLDLDAMLETGNVIVAVGNGSVEHRTEGQMTFRFADAFTFRDDQVCHLASYVVPTTNELTPGM